MFKKGQRVVCINDTFQAWAVMLYNELPIKGRIYTIRDTAAGRTDPKDQGMNSLDISVLLEEIRNPNDPHFKGGTQELGFKSDRFRPLKKKKSIKKQHATA